MSATSQKPSNREWLWKLVTGRPHMVIGGTEQPYLRRWYLIPRNPWCNVYLHQFLRSDDDRALHDHPWWFWSVMLRGSYIEVTDKGWLQRDAPSLTTWAGNRRRGQRVVAFRRPEQRHRVELMTGREWKFDREEMVEEPCWTLVVTGRKVRDWGFWCQNWDTRRPLTGRSMSPSDPVERFVPWQEFGDAGCGES